MNAAMGVGISKGKKATTSTLNGPSKAAVISAGAGVGGAINIEPGFPRVRAAQFPKEECFAPS